MKLNDEFSITKITLDDFEFKIPQGLSEFFNRVGAWEYKDQDSLPLKDENLKTYNRKVEFKDGRLRTYLIHKSEVDDNEMNKKEVANLNFFSS